MNERSLEAGLISADADALAAFYVNALGFDVQQVLELPQGIVHRLRSGNARVKIHQPAGGIEQVARGTAWNQAAGFRYAALHVDDADSVVDRAERFGATTMTPPTAHRPGARFALIADPDGNVWEILEEGLPGT